MTNHPTSHEFDAYSPEIIASPAGEMLAVRFDVQPLLEQHVGPDWRQRISAIVQEGEEVIRSDDHYTIREPMGKFGLITGDARRLAYEAPGIWELYQGTFKQMMQMALPADAEPLRSYDDPIMGLEPLSQMPQDLTRDVRHRLEAHVDQRYSAVVVLKAPPAEAGGRLVIGTNPNAQSIAEINDGALFITHRPGTLLCFSRGRVYPHYTEEITDPTAERVTVSLNYPTESETPEEGRKLTEHTIGRPIA